jgi:hypothetical protein
MTSGEGIGDKAHGGRETHGHSNAEACTEHDHLKTSFGETEGDSEDGEKTAAGNPDLLWAYDVGNGAKHKQKTPS